MLYPSGMLVARPAADGTGALSYTKYYFAGSQRVSSKIGTTTNLGKFLQDWTLIENSSGGAPINLVSTSGDQLTTAETGVTHVYTQFAITPTPTFSSNTAFLPVTSFTVTGTENEIYWFHPDHLGSSNYITNFVGEVSQHMEYFAFGETFIEEHKNSHNSPYKFNGKELDEESGYTYYGARYLDMRYNFWISTDPLSGYNPIFEEEHYIDGEHNLGVLNSFNLATYSYCYQNPINLFDPNGKQSKAWNRTMGALQCVGGVLEIAGSGLGEWFSGGAATPLMVPLALNGLDNTQAGFRQLLSGESTETMLHKGTKATAKALGASNKNAERIATVADLSTIILGNGAAIKNLLKSGKKAITEGAGVYNLLTSGGRYIGQSKNFLKRVANHFASGGKLSNFTKITQEFHLMEKSTKYERELYE
jgi:RHS repeat-associated protein